MTAPITPIVPANSFIDASVAREAATENLRYSLEYLKDELELKIKSHINYAISVGKFICVIEHSEVLKETKQLEEILTKLKEAGYGINHNHKNQCIVYVTWR